MTSDHNPAFEVLDAIADGVIGTDANGVILKLNAACERLFGYAPEAATGLSIEHLLSQVPATEPTGDENAPAPVAVENVIGHRKDGTTFPVELSRGTVSNSGEIRTIQVIRDVTYRRRMEQSLRDSEAQHRAVLETAVDGFVIIDARGIVRMFNRASEQMFGFSADEVLGNSVRMLMPAPYKDQHDIYLANYHRTGERKIIGVGREVLGSRKGGTTFPMEVAVGEMQLGGDQYFVGILRDITEANQAREDLAASQLELRKRVEESESARIELRDKSDMLAKLAAEKDQAWRAAERVNEHKSEFLATISHEIRTPMNGIMGTLDLLAAADLSDKDQQLVDVARASATGLLAVVNDVLDLSKLEAGQVSLERHVFSLAQLVRQAYSLMRVSAEAKNIDLVLELEPDMPEAVLGDSARISQVLNNLIGNAIKFTEHGEVRISVNSELSAGVCLVHFAVEDTGAGITREAQEVLFERFAQADASITRRFGGTGLGLSICKQLVETMSGKIGVQSAPGKGSRFWFDLTLQVAEADQTSGEEQPSSSGPVIGPLHVLVADDNETNQLITSRMLERLGHTVELVADGDDAVNAVAEGQFDLVLMDGRMPRLSGEEATRQVRELNNAKAGIPIVALTADAMQADKDRYFACGMNGYITKPIDLGTLANELQRLNPRRTQ